jgi:hypothetical protein
MKMRIGVTILTCLLFSCSAVQEKSKPENVLPILGTWKLISGTTIQKGDTTTTYYDKNLSFIKIINDSHFAFLNHDIHKGKDSATAAYSSGGGSYTLLDSTYTEHLEYCSDRQWEGNDFKFTIRIKNDTLTQTGIEKVESAGVDRLNIERYARVK